MENKTQNLLQHVSIISKKYDDIAKITGENFNVFSVMSMESDERFTHSAIIGELLNPKGSHSQGSVFLKLFVEEISSLKEIENFDFENAKVIIEEHIGLIDEKYSKGGFIDIVLKDNNNVIVIENKIYAGDQKNQLVRYKNHYPNGKMLYLNLFGDEPSKDSSGNLIIDTDFHIISYKTEITNWIEKCHKESVEQPIIRETIKQYLYLIKKLTNQTTNDKMSEEIVKLISKYPKESFEIANNVSKFKREIYFFFMNKIRDYALKKEISVNDCWLENDKEYGLFLKPNQWSNKPYNICIIFEKSNYRGLYFGVSYEENFVEEEKTKLREKFSRNGFKENDWWIWRYVKDTDWQDNPKIWEDAATGENSSIYNEIINGIEEIVKIEKQ